MANDKKPPSKEEVADKINSKRFVSRPPIQVPTLPRQPEKTLQAELDAIKNQRFRGGMENLSAPNQSSQSSTGKPITDPALADKIRAAQDREVRGVEKVSPAEGVRPDPAPAKPQSTNSERALFRSRGGDNKTLRNPGATLSAPTHTTPSHIVEANQKNLAQEKSGSDERADVRQDKGRPKEQSKEKNRDKGKDNER